MTFLQQIVKQLAGDGLRARIEYPDCIAIPHREQPNREWWFGIVNPTWQADLLNEQGDAVGSLDTGVPRETTDVSAIARGIIAALNARGGM